MQYRVKGSDSTKDITVTSSSTEATISGLDSATNYSIEVAAVNIAGIGAYSNPVYVVTKGMVATYCFATASFTPQCTCAEV